MRFATGILLLFAALAGGQQFAVQTHTLDNGMKLLIQEDHNIPEVALYFFFKVGSRNEHVGATGVSHFFEHMMFNGAKKYGPKQFDIVMEKNGGNNNASTSEDETVYTDWFPSPLLEQMMDMEADRIRDLSFEAKMIESERGVVYSERRNGEDSPFGSLYELLKASAFIAHPYHWPVVGWPSDIQSWTMEDLQTHFRMGYAPNNCVMVAVGDVKAEEVIALAKKYLEPIPRHDPPPPVRTVEPEQKGERRVELNKPAESPLLMIGYHVPRTDSPEHYAIELLGNVLAEGRSSRLYRRLVDGDQLAISVEQSSQFSFDPGLMVFTVQPKGGTDPVRSEKAFTEEIERVRTEGISAEELQKAKNQWLAEFYRGMSRIAVKAYELGQYEVFLGDYRKLHSAGQDVEKVTADEVRNAAQHYLGRKNRTVGTLIPEKPEVSK